METMTHLPTPLPLRHPLIDPGLEERARKLAARYTRPRQREFCMIAAGRHPRAIDYLEQAPILLVALSEMALRPNVWAGARWQREVMKPSGTPPMFGKGCNFALDEWRKLVELGWRLPKVLAHYRVAPQLRRLLPGVCTSAAWWPVILMTRQMDGTALAQAIPDKLTAQRRWLKAQVTWYRRMLDRNRAMTLDGLDHPLAYTCWAAVAFGRGPHNIRAMPGAVADIADFAIARGPRFNTRWSVVQAADACGLWHHELAAEQTGTFENDPPVDYAPFPDVFVASDGLRVVALKTRQALYEEGAAMKHCVLDYHLDVLAGRSRIFSVRRPDGQAICTLELRHDGHVDVPNDPTPASFRGVRGDEPAMPETFTRHPRWMPVQAQGWRASMADPRPRQPAEAALAVQQFLEAHCPGWPRRNPDARSATERAEGL